MATRDVKVYICDWCSLEEPVTVVHHCAAFSLGADTEDYSDAPIPKGWFAFQVPSTERDRFGGMIFKRDFLCTECNALMLSAVSDAYNAAKKSKQR